MTNSSMKRKIYAKYNNRAKMIEFIFIDVNDDEAIYKFEKANIEAEEKNKYYNREDYTLIAIGVLNMEGSKEEVGIIYDYKDDFNYIFDEVKDEQKPKYNQTYFENMQVWDEKRKQELELKSKGVNVDARE